MTEKLFDDMKAEIIRLRNRVKELEEALNQDVEPGRVVAKEAKSLRKRFFAPITEAAGHTS